MIGNTYSAAAAQVIFDGDSQARGHGLNQGQDQPSVVMSSFGNKLYPWLSVGLCDSQYLGNQANSGGSIGTLAQYMARVRPQWGNYSRPRIYCWAGESDLWFANQSVAQIETSLTRLVALGMQSH